MSIPANELINQYLTELGYISTANGYLNNFNQVRADYLALNLNNDFDFICIYPYGSDKPIYDTNDNIPSASEMELYIDLHIKAIDVSGDLTYKIEAVKQDMMNWLYFRKSITANKYCLVGETNTSTTGAIYKGYELTNIFVFRDPDTNIALIRFALKQLYNLNI